MAGYSKDFLITAFLSRYESIAEDKFSELADMAVSFYDSVGRDKFRVYCCLDASAIKKFKEQN